MSPDAPLFPSPQRGEGRVRGAGRGAPGRSPLTLPSLRDGPLSLPAGERESEQRRRGKIAGGPVARMLPDRRRLHLQHGPIDLVIEAFGDPAEVRRAYGQAWARFGAVLPELVAELPLLRRVADK